MFLNHWSPDQHMSTGNFHWCLLRLPELWFLLPPNRSQNSSQASKGVTSHKQGLETALQEGSLGEMNLIRLPFQYRAAQVAGPYTPERYSCNQRGGWEGRWQGALFLP